MTFLIDTCVLSEVRRLGPNEVVRDWLLEQRSDEMFVSAITIGEIARGIALLPEGPRKHQLRGWLSATRKDFNDRILAVDDRVAENWGELEAETRKNGVTVPMADALIAATARNHGMHVVTRNTRHFLEAGAAVFNPWTGEYEAPKA